VRGEKNRDGRRSDFRDAGVREIPHSPRSVTKMPRTSHLRDPRVSFRARIEGPEMPCVYFPPYGGPNTRSASVRVGQHGRKRGVPDVSVTRSHLRHGPRRSGETSPHTPHVSSQFSSHSDDYCELTSVGRLRDPSQRSMAPPRADPPPPMVPAVPATATACPHCHRRLHGRRPTSDRAGWFPGRRRADPQPACRPEGLTEARCVARRPRGSPA
jgi:hypothetical protein